MILNLEKMKKIVYLFFALLLPICSFAQEEAVDPKAKAILEKAVDAFDSKKGISADFLIEIKDSRNGKTETIPGILLLKGEKFKLSLRNVDTYFDGKTQSVFMSNEKEVTISIPEKEDLKDINPILLMKSYQTDYKMRYLGSKKEAGLMFEEVELYPNDLKSQYSIIRLKISKEKLQLKSILLKGKSGIDTKLSIQNLGNKDLSDATFIFDEKKFPDVEIIDLR